MRIEKTRIFQQFGTILEFIAIGILYLLTVYWSTQAFMKYLDEPASTTISYTFGDPGKDGKITFPSITFCRPPSEYQRILYDACSAKVPSTTTSSTTLSSESTAGTSIDCNTEK